MPKKKLVLSDEPLIPRPHRNMRAKIVFDPSDNYIPKKRRKFGSKSEKSAETSSVKKNIYDKKKTQDNKSKSYLENNLIDFPSNEVNALSPIHSPSKSPERHASIEIFEEVCVCFICSKTPTKKELVDCPICMIKAHRDCLTIIEPMWKFKLDNCPWLCKHCRKQYCSKCLKDESKSELLCRCITCKVGLHAECYEWYDIKPLHKLKTDMYICIPCMTLATQRVPGVEKEEEDEGEDEEEFSDGTPTSPNYSPNTTDEDEEILQTNKISNLSAAPLKCEKKYSDFQKPNIPNVTKWDKFQVYDYLVKRLPAEIAVKVIDKDVDGTALQLLQRTDITLNMGLKLGYAMKLYKQVRILQTQSTYYSVFWE